MDDATLSAITQLGLSGIFCVGIIRLFTILMDRYKEERIYLIETIAGLRQQNTILMEQNRQLSVALFANNPDAQRAYTAMSRQTHNMPNQAITNLGEPT